jgi:hypothetical protein
MGETISSYKRLMNDPETAEVWKTAFGKDFGRMTQGDDKTGLNGTNSVFVMTHTEIDIAKAAGHTWTYARIIVDHRPQKEDPNRIRITSGGNLITYKGNTSTPHHNCYGTVSSAWKEHNICASMLKTSTSRQPWITMNT